jgi:hypothetical protein
MIQVGIGQGRAGLFEVCVVRDSVIRNIKLRSVKEPVLDGHSLCVENSTQ